MFSCYIILSVMKKMSDKEALIKKLYRAVNLMACESKLARDYGTPHELTASDIDFLKCVEKNAAAKASELSIYLGVTNGATTQLAKKLEAKGYVEPYRLAGNKKEVFYRLTETGQTACRGFDAHYAKINRDIESYVQDLDEETARQIGGLFDTMAASLSVGDHCSAQLNAEHNDCPPEAGEKKCEKCQKNY